MINEDIDHYLLISLDYEELRKMCLLGFNCKHPLILNKINKVRDKVNFIINKLNMNKPYRLGEYYSNTKIHFKLNQSSLFYKRLMDKYNITYEDEDGVDMQYFEYPYDFYDDLHITYYKTKFELTYGICYGEGIEYILRYNASRDQLYLFLFELLFNEIIQYDELYNQFIKI